MLLASFFFSSIATAGFVPSPSFKAEATNASGSEGQTVSVSVYLDPVGVDFWEYSLKVAYDPSVLTFQGAIDEVVGAAFVPDTSVTGAVYVQRGNFPEIFINEKTAVVSLSFQIKPGASTGNTTIDISEATYTADTEPVAIHDLTPGTITIMSNQPPAAANLTVNGTPRVGETLTGTYDYSDAEGNPEADSTFQWYEAADSTGAGKTAVTDAVYKTLELTQAMLGKYVIFSVVPMSSAGRTVGEAVYSAPFGPIAGGTAALRIGSVSGFAGQTVEVPVTVTSTSSGIGSYGLQLGFDTAALEVASITGQSGELFASRYNNTDGWLKVGWADATGGDQPIQSGGNLFKVSFLIKNTASIGDKSMTIQEDDPLHFTVTDVSGNELSKTIEIGKITVNRRNEENSASTPSVPSAPAETGKKIEVIVDGVKQSASATAVTTKEGDKDITRISVENEVVIAKLEKDSNKTLTIPVVANKGDVVVELKGHLVKALESKDGLIEMNAANGSYKIPAAQIPLDQIISGAGGNVKPEDVRIEIQIKETPGSTVSIVQKAASEANLSIIAPNVDFEVSVHVGDTTTKVDRFSQFVERSITIPEGVDPSQITTGLVLNEDGTLTHVPTRVVQQDGKFVAIINSLTNSTYSVVYNDKQFADAQDHWAKADINDMASRMVIQGTSATTFEPDRGISRAEFVATLVRGLGLHNPNSVNAGAGFSDVPNSAWFQEAVKLSTQYKLIEGYEDGTFRPDQLISREEAMVILQRAMTVANLQLQLSASEAEALLSSFKDNSSLEPWARQAAAVSLKQGITQGVDETLLSPDGIVTRAQTAVLVRRLLQTANLINK
jgi:hypothetical protein